MSSDRRALVLTVVHHPEDSRIRHRQIEALLAAGWTVTYAAPFSAHGLSTARGPAGLTQIDLPRARGRRRLAAAWAARRLVHHVAHEHDVLVVHDPELVVALMGLADGMRVWDVHEDPAAALLVKEWMPRPLRRTAAWLWRRAERMAESRWDLLLAEQTYQGRFRRTHVVIPNTTAVPLAVSPVAGSRVVYLGNLTLARGAASLVEMAEILHRRTKGAVVTHVVGPARDDATRALLEAAVQEGAVVWHGFLPAREALSQLDGAVAGVSLLQDLPNYRGSMPTKIVEYLAHGVPVVTTPLPAAVELIDACHGGLVVPFDDPQAAADAVLTLMADPGLRERLAISGRRYVAEHLDWRALAPLFVDALAAAASRTPPSKPAEGIDEHLSPDLRYGGPTTHTTDPGPPHRQ